MSGSRAFALGAALLAVGLGACAGSPPGDGPGPGDPDARDDRSDGGGGGGDPTDGGGTPDAEDGFAPTSLVDALELFGDCMSYDDFQSTNIQDVANQTTSNGPCTNCHGGGSAGVALTSDDATFYTWQRDLPYILKLVTGEVNDDGTFRDVAPARRYELKREDPSHPSYTLSPARIDAVDTFFDLTYARYQNAIETETPCVRDTP